MKFFMIAVVVAAMVGATMVGCGPQQTYCPTSSTGQCNFQDTGTAPPMMDAGSGDSIIINGDV